MSACALPLHHHPRIVMAHGSGGKLTAELIAEVFLPAFDNPTLARLDDQAVVTLGAAPGSPRLAFTTDSFVVTPLEFPGGDIGSLAVHGTANDLAMGGARPRFLSAAFILEEGLDRDLLARIAHSMGTAARAAGVAIVTGDTKVVNHGKGDQIFICTSGVGELEPGRRLGPELVRPGDRILLSGSLGDHGLAILALREGLEFEGTIVSDTANLYPLVRAMLDADPGHGLRCMRDPTRGGLATSLHEICERARVGMRLDEPTLPVRDNVQGACELLGLDPLYVANEGKLVALCAPDTAPAVLAAMRRHPLGADAVDIGAVTATPAGMLLLATAIGGTRVLDLLFGEQLPRIC